MPLIVSNGGGRLLRASSSFAQAPASELAQAAAALSAGQCIQLDTGLVGSDLIYASEGANFIQWGNSAVYDPTRQEVRFVGKRDGSGAYPFHMLVYDEATNAWSQDRTMWTTENSSGHGYDHNACDPSTGNHYFREYGASSVHIWDGSWSNTGSFSSPSATIVGGLSWFPGVGLMYNDGASLKKYASGSWSTISSFGGGSYHDFSEYNSTANVLIFGGGNSSAYRKMTSGESVSLIMEGGNAPPFTLGAASDQGLTISDPNSDTLIAYQRTTPWAWYAYDISADTWSQLTESTGDGSSPQTGTPNLPNDNLPVIACPIEDYGVIMYVKYVSNGSTPGEVWLYRHS